MSKDLTTDEFFELLNQKTEKVRKNQKSIEEKKEILQKDCYELADYIKTNWKTKAKKASEKGRIFVDLYFPKQDDNKNIFLLCAPSGQNLSWFTKQGIKPTMHILQEELKPFKVQYVRTTFNNKFINSVRLTWAK